MKPSFPRLFLYLALFSIPFICSCREKDAPMKMNTPRNIKGVVGFQRTFNDKNELHLFAAEATGIPPIDSREEAKKMKRKLSLIETNELYVVDSLTHSIPYLVPRAKTLMAKIGSNFLDSLDAKGLNPNKLIVTSVLRTREDVNRLRKRNVNSSETSCHSYGTTFDVSYKRFEKVEKKRQAMQDVSPDTLKLVLAEVLRDLRKEEQCYVKYEVKQACFHITAR